MRVEPLCDLGPPVTRPDVTRSSSVSRASAAAWSAVVVVAVSLELEIEAGRMDMVVAICCDKCPVHSQRGLY